MGASFYLRKGDNFMIKKTIKYTDFDGNDVTEDCYFHLSKAKLAEKELDSDGGFSAMLKDIGENKDGARIMKMMKTFILESYGVKSEDGKHFYQSEELSKDFEATEAYSELYMELCTDTDAAINFITGIFPFNDSQKKELAAKIDEIKTNNEV